MRCGKISIVVLAGIVFSLAMNHALAGEMTCYIGTYTGPKSKGIYRAKFDSRTGVLGTPELAMETKNPSFLALHPNRRFLYAVGEINSFDGKPAGAVSAFRIEPGTGRLALINQQPSGGAGPTHLSVDPSGKCVLVANYGGGSIAALPINRDGSLAAASKVIQHEGSSVNPQRQKGPHAHQILPDPKNRFVLTCDLGLDKVLVYRFDPARGSLEAHHPPSISTKPGAGPRHLAFHPDGKFIYVINELDSSMTAYRLSTGKGLLEEVATVSTLPEGFTNQNSCAEVQVHPSGKFVYGSNRGHDSIAVFRADAKTGKLSLVEHESTGGKAPRFFGLDPSGSWLLAGNQASDTVVIFKVDNRSGALTPTGQTIGVGAPVCFVFHPGR